MRLRTDGTDRPVCKRPTLIRMASGQFDIGPGSQIVVFDGRQ